MRCGGVASTVLCLSVIVTSAEAQWRFDESRDAMTDTTSARTYAEGDGGAIGIRCDQTGSNSLFLHLATGSYLGGDGSGYAVRQILYRFDDDPPVSSYWKYDGRDAIMTRRDEVRKFIDRLKAAKSLKMRAFTYDRQSVDVNIPVAGADSEIEKVIAACGAARW